MRFAILCSFLAACGGVSSSSPDGPPPAPDAAPPDAATCHATAGAAAERVATTVGVVHGAMAGTTWAYLGVPFAAPPVGALRLAAPEPAACATAELDATKLGATCAQLDPSGNVIGSEDCLQLNVWAPAAAAAPRPVFVFIHGGANAVGSATDPLYDGRALAEAGNLIVVTINYRVGQLGFLAHPALAAEGTGSGDFGLLDQILALRWVHDNIAAFGGDPANVTIAGESAGARDVCSLVASPMAAGLFGRAIMESGSCKGLPDRATAEATGAAYATAAGCSGNDVASCLRALPLDTALKTMPPDPSILVSTAYQPAIDGAVQTGEPAAVIAAGAHNHVDFVVGANADETGKAAPMIPDEATYKQIVQQQYGPIADAVLAQYPASDYPTPRAAYVRLTTDARFVCPSREIARTVAAAQTQPVYRYFFAYAGPSKLGAVHGLELPFVFDTFGAIMAQNGPYQPTAADLAVSATMQGDWTRFAASGAPGGAPAWPRWDTTDPTMVFAAAPSVVDGIRTSACDFWKPYYDAH